MRMLFALFLCVFAYANTPQDSAQDSVTKSLPITESSAIENSANQNDLSILGLYKNADSIVKSVICVLIAFSVLTWAVFAAKCVEFKMIFSYCKNDLHILKQFNGQAQEQSLQKTHFAKILYDESLQEIRQSSLNDNNLKSRIKYRLEHRASILLANAKKWIAILASIGSSAPFIGLFGTVWGIMDSFIGIAKSDNTSLAVVAPGIAEALFATAFGLIAAIPAVLFYNALIRLSVSLNAQISEILTHIYCIAERSIYTMQANTQKN
ncbi:MotA/TolQ/ExbB proton channel family protein [Helicobacter jaachi]|uniref:MotA/TolQ/ExbB proton channel family protein n=2 Tax=Helicobacter jaachi TaxID=1677920 RepID=A0A4U8TBX0_9HELI|nr:MotA/TolQ/ExbB proton channel family protein [Helicobacter jaachi]